MNNTRLYYSIGKRGLYYHTHIHALIPLNVLNPLLANTIATIYYRDFPYNWHDIMIATIIMTLYILQILAVMSNYISLCTMETPYYTLLFDINIFLRSHWL